MRLDARRVAAFLRDPGAARAVLLYGDDAGLIRERAAALAETVAGSSDDPFRIVELDRDRHAAIPDEMASLSLTGGRRVVWVRDAGDAATAAVEAALAGPGEALLIVEASGLASRSRLRTLAERAEAAVAIACYPEAGANLKTTIRETLAARDVTIEADALDWLAVRLGGARFGDRAATRAEAEKLALLAGKGGRIDAAMAQQSAGELGGASLEDALFAATAGDVARADRTLELALAEGTAPVAVVRAALMHVQLLVRAAAAMAAGMDAATAAKAARPPVFFRRIADFTAALARWKAPALAAAAVALWETERAIKQTGAPAETICRNAVLGIARRAASRRPSPDPAIV